MDIGAIRYSQYFFKKHDDPSVLLSRKINRNINSHSSLSNHFYIVKLAVNAYSLGSLLYLIMVISVLNLLGGRVCKLLLLLLIYRPTHCGRHILQVITLIQCDCGL